MRRGAIAVGLAALGIAVGIFSVRVARHDPGYWFAGGSTLAGIALLAAGWALVGWGLAFWVGRPGGRFGPLRAAAGFAWFLPEWNNPGIGSAFAFTVGLCLYAACPPLVGHAVLAYPGGRLASTAERVAVGAAYLGGVGVLGVLPALDFDPPARGCTQCPENLLAISDRGVPFADLDRAGLYLGIAWALALAVLALRRLFRAPASTRPVLVAGAVYLGLVALWFGLSLDRGELSNGTVERRLWLGQAAALLLVSGSVAWSWARGRRARSTVAQLVIDLAQSPPPGGLRDVLARTVGDDDLVLAYLLEAPGLLVDGEGRRVTLDHEQQQTRLVREGRVLAVLGHAPGLLDDEQLVEDVTSAARLALDNERLQAEVRARIDDLRASRARIVQAGDVERKRLERDLHDGAQQRLVGLSLSLRLARGRLAAGVGSEAVPLFDEADTELREAIADLRELAHGIFPAVLADEGLGAAVEALAEDGRVPVRIRGLDEGRFPAQVESAAYAVVAEARRATTTGVVVRTQRSDTALRVEVETHDELGLDLVGLQDRLGALDGSLVVDRSANGDVTLRAELPCGS